MIIWSTGIWSYSRKSDTILSINEFYTFQNSSSWSHILLHVTKRKVTRTGKWIALYDSFFSSIIIKYFFTIQIFFFREKKIKHIIARSDTDIIFCIWTIWKLCAFLNIIWFFIKFTVYCDILGQCYHFNALVPSNYFI